jgi:hypothetical protein
MSVLISLFFGLVTINAMADLFSDDYVPKPNHHPQLVGWVIVAGVTAWIYVILTNL